jgi:hypothetical protein
VVVTRQPNAPNAFYLIKVDHKPSMGCIGQPNLPLLVYSKRRFAVRTAKIKTDQTALRRSRLCKVTPPSSYRFVCSELLRARSPFPGKYGEQFASEFHVPSAIMETSI